MDVSVVSAKTNLSGNAYRQLENGTINMGKIKNFTEIPTYKRGNQQQAIRTLIFLFSRQSVQWCSFCQPACAKVDLVEMFWLTEEL
jgi:hypothetical protein